ncbi:hypothetical protein D3C78_1555640 [compost metagenome]
MQHATDEVFVCRSLLANVALAAAVHLQPGTQLLRVLFELVFAGVGRQAVHMHLASLADPQDMVVERVLVCCEYASQFINRWLIIQIHV